MSGTDPGGPAASPPGGGGGLVRVLLDVVVVATLLALAVGVVVDRGGDAGADTRLRWAVALLASSTGILWLLFHGTRRALRDVQELLADVRFGGGTRRDRDAVEILVRALRTPEAAVRETALRQLRRLTGVDLGEDPRSWERWWKGARATFSRGAAAVERAGGGGGPSR